MDREESSIIVSSTEDLEMELNNNKDIQTDIDNGARNSLKRRFTEPLPRTLEKRRRRRFTSAEGRAANKDEAPAMVCQSPLSPVTVEVNPTNVIYLIDSDSDTEADAKIKHEKTKGAVEVRMEQQENSSIKKRAVPHSPVHAKNKSDFIRAVLWLYADHYKYLVQDKRSEIFSATINHGHLWAIINDIQNAYEWFLFSEYDRKKMRNNISIMRKNGIFNYKRYIDTLEVPADKINAIQTIINNEKSEPRLRAPQKTITERRASFKPRWEQRSFRKPSNKKSMTLDAKSNTNETSIDTNAQPEGKRATVRRQKKPRPGPSGRKAPKPIVAIQSEALENRTIQLPPDVFLQSKRWQPYVRIWINSVSNIQNRTTPSLAALSPAPSSPSSIEVSTTSSVPLPYTLTSAFKDLFDVDEKTAMKMYNGLALLPTMFDLNGYAIKLGDLSFNNDARTMSSSPGQKAIKAISRNIRTKLSIDIPQIYMNLYIFEILCINEKFIGNSRTFIGTVHVDNDNFAFFYKLLWNLEYYQKHMNYMLDRYISVDFVNDLKFELNRIINKRSKRQSQKK